jgi:hypothetical protein
MALAESFQTVVDALPEDWTDLQFDLRIADERRYVESCVLMTVAGAQPYSKSDWHWRVTVANTFGNGAAVDSVIGALKMLDDSRIEGELVVRELRSGRAPVMNGWGRPESVRQEFRRLHHQ